MVALTYADPESTYTQETLPASARRSLSFKPLLETLNRIVGTINTDDMTFDRELGEFEVPGIYSI